MGRCLRLWILASAVGLDNPLVFLGVKTCNFGMSDWKNERQTTRSQSKYFLLERPHSAVTSAPAAVGEIEPAYLPKRGASGSCNIIILIFFAPAFPSCLTGASVVFVNMIRQCVAESRRAILTFILSSVVSTATLSYLQALSSPSLPQSPTSSQYCSRSQLL